MSALGNISRDPLVYICGEAYLKNSTESPSLRDIIISDLAVLWAVRTHQMPDGCVDTRNGNDDLFRVICCSSVFVFIFSKKTLDDSFFLNQYGMAKSYDIPVVGVRLTNYFLRSPLPEQYFRTEVVNNSNCAANRNVPEATKKVSLAEHLINDFKSAVVYGPDFHRSCMERLTHKVAQACNKRENEKAFVEPTVKHVSKGSLENKRNEYPKSAAKCPKCGFPVRDFGPPKLQRASSTGSLLQRSNTLVQFPCKVTATRNGRTPLQTSRIQIPSPRAVKTSQRTENTSYGNWTFKLDRKLVEPKIQAKPGLVLSPESPNKEETEFTTNESTTNPKIFRQQSRGSNGSWTERLRNKLRRQSSLPVIPTTYLVTTPDGVEKQISLVKYPPEKREIRSPLGSDSTTVFSEDEDQETIHISRVPSPDVPSG